MSLTNQGPEPSTRRVLARAVLHIFRTVDRPDYCQQYLGAHSRRLKLHRIDNLHSAQEKWLRNPFVWVLVAQDGRSKDFLAGCRLHVAAADYPLPMVEALGETDPRVYERLHRQYPGPPAEIAGLWRARGRGAPASSSVVVLLARAVFALAHRLGVPWTWGLAPSHTLTLWRRFGVQIDSYLGEDGGFYYPDDRFFSRVLHLETRELRMTPACERERILELSRVASGVVLDDEETKTAFRIELCDRLSTAASFAHHGSTP